MSHETRLENLEKNKKCSIKSVSYNRLNKQEIRFVEFFIENNDDLSDRDFKGIANHLFADGETDRDMYPHYIEIIETLMLICSE